MSIQVTLYLDTRRAKQSGLFPAKLRVWDSLIKKAKFYPIGIDFNEKDFDATWNKKRPIKAHQEDRIKLDLILSNANKVVSLLPVFTFERFEKKLFRKSGEGNDVFYHCTEAVNRLKKGGKLSTAETYELSKKSFVAFEKSKNLNSKSSLSLYNITVEWLNDYQKYMTDKGRSLTTVGIYLRCMRALFNSAISEDDINKEFYPFGKNKYQIPSVKNKKKALSSEQLRILFKAKVSSPEQKKARDFWFFSYSCNGMNIKDIAQTRYKDIEDGVLSFYRAKTLNTSKHGISAITVHLTDYANTIIKKYASKKPAPDKLVFDIIKDDESEEKKRVRIKNFTRFINQHIKKVCEVNDLPMITTYWARHSFATNSIRKGASMEFVQESLGHEDLKTTMNYFAGFDDETKKEFAEKLMDF
tara:strand:- start:137 stop:1378 length:1242 start_codon:yes stop_codon:yes gene_type:complete